MQALLPQIVEQILKDLRDWGIEAQRKETAGDFDYSVVAEEAVK